MGQQSSRQPKNIIIHKKLPSFLFGKNRRTTRTPNPEQPIKFQYKTSKKSGDQNIKTRNSEKLGFRTINNLKSVLGSVKNINELKDTHANIQESVDSRDLQNFNFYVNGTRNNVKAAEKLKDTNVQVSESKIVVRKTGRDSRKQNVPLRTKSEPNLECDKNSGRHRHRRKARKLKEGCENKVQQFGYEIQDVDEFLAKATLEKPANIPVVLAFPSVLYQTRIGGYQAEISLPLGMVVNAIFRNQNWLYVQTPHAEEGYISYSACLPLGIIPPQDDDKSSPCWEKSTDIFPKPSGNMTDTEKLSCKSECGNENDTYYSTSRYRSAFSTCGEKSVDRLYLRAVAIAKGKGTRHTLLVINEDYKSLKKGAISVWKNEVVFLLDASIKGWFYVKNKEGHEGFIPSIIAGHGFL